MNYLTKALSAAIIFFTLSGGQTLCAEDGNGAGEGAGGTAPSRFVETVRGTILDTETGLMWLGDANIVNSPLPWQSAKRYIQEMNSGARPNYGFTNWRLPSINDFETLLDKSQSNPALPQRHPFEKVRNDFYWSSSIGTDIVDYAWTIDLATGNKISMYRSYCNFRYFWPTRYTWNSAATKSGMIFTGGANQNGQLGDGTAGNRTSLMPVSKLSNIVKIAAGLQHALAINEDGTVSSWGDNSQGQLGRIGTPSESRDPVLVEGLRTIVDIAAGKNHSLALKADGTVWAWGQNLYGQLGNANIPESRIPLKVSGLSKVVKIAAGMNHSLAVKADGTVWVWGQNVYGQLGVGDKENRFTPAYVKGVSQVVKVSAGTNHSLAVKADGTLWAWGGNLSGQLGDGTISDKNLPVQTYGLSGVVDAAGGEDHSLALKDDGTVWAWGSNEFNQLGSGDVAQVSAASVVEGVNKVTKITAGPYHSLVLFSNGTVALWGKNIDSIERKTRPYAINYVKDIFDLAAGRYFTMLLSEQAVDQ